MALKLKNLIGGFSRLALMGSVALPSTLTVALGAGMISAPLVFAPTADAAVIIGNRNRIKEKPRRNYKSTVRIDSDIEDAAVEVLVTGEIRFFAPDGTSGPVREFNLVPNESSSLSMDNPIFEGVADAPNNVLSAKVEGGSCDGTEVNIEVPFESKTPVEFTLCDNGENTVDGKAWFTNAGKTRVTFNVPTDISARTALYGEILIDGVPLEMERTVYTGDVNDVEVGAVAGFTYEQTITVTDLYGKTLDSQTVRGIIGGDDVDVMGPSHVIIGDRNRIKERPRQNYKSVSVTRADDNGEIGIEDKIFRIDGDFVYTFTGSGDDTNGPIIPDSVISDPARVNAAFNYGDGPKAGDTLFGGFCGGSFSMRVGGVDAEESLVIDDMGGADIEGTSLKIRANRRLDGTLGVRIKGDYSAIENCQADSLFVENTGPLSDSFVNYIWEGDIDVDPRTFDGYTYKRTATLLNENGTVLDRFIDQVTIKGPDAETLGRTAAVIIGDRNKIRQKPRRNYRGFVTTEQPLVLAAENYTPLLLVYNFTAGPDIAEDVTVETPLTSMYQFEIQGDGSGGPFTPDRAWPITEWCGINLADRIPLETPSEIGETGVTASLTERANGNFRLKVKGPGTAFENQCAGEVPLMVDGVPAYSINLRNIWRVDLQNVPEDLPTDTVFVTDVSLKTQDSEIVARTLQTVTANDAPRTQAQLTSARFDRGVQAVFDGRIVAEGFDIDEEPNLSFFVSDNGGGNASALTTNVCHLFETPSVTFADPESVTDMKYLVELTASDNDGDEIAYIEHEVIPTKSTTFETALGQFGRQIGESPFQSYILTNKNEGEDDFGMSVGLCGKPKTISELSVFMTPLDGGSELDPEDFQMGFVEKDLIADASFNTDTLAFGETVFVETKVTANGETVDIWECQDNALKSDGSGDQLCGTTDHFRPRSGVTRRTEILKAAYRNRKLSGLDD